MKKFMILLAVVCLIFVSCGNKKQQIEQVEETCCTEILAKWDTFADLDEEGQIALVAEMKAYLDECKAKCESKCTKTEGEEVAEDACPGKAAKCAEKAAKCAEIKTKWEEFDNLPLEEQKALLDQILEHKAKCNKKEAATEEEVTD
ncbi:MAG: hypothetical protein LBI45_03535 [Bacteroidales bacterium]|jgi:hypothetical protein|nr:hypothetical protein [Bacteroidales bacterium]